LLLTRKQLLPVSRSLGLLCVMAHSKPSLILALLLLNTACPAAGASVMRVHYGVRSTGEVEAMQSHSATDLASMFSDDLEAKAVTSKLLAKGTPSEELLPFVQKLKKEIQPWHDKSEATLKAAKEEIESCTAGMKQGMRETDAQKNSCSAKSTSHTTHRTDESTKFTAKEQAAAVKAEKKEAMTTECNAFQTVKDEARSATASYSSGDEGAYLESVSHQFCDDLLPRYNDHKAKCTTATAEHVKASEVYETKNIAYTAQKTASDTVQRGMDVTCCEYSLATKDVCTSHHTCYEDKVEAYKAVEAIIKAEEKVKKVEWRVYSRIECLLPVLGTDQASKIEECRDKTHDTSHLDIDYPSIPEKSECHADDAFPGTDAYYSTHFGNLPDNAKGKNVAKCTGMMGGAAAKSWVKVHDPSQGYLDCPHLTGSNYGLNANCPKYSSAEACQSDCLNQVTGCNGINFHPSNGVCCFKDCVDPANPIFSVKGGYDVWVYRQ